MRIQTANPEDAFTIATLLLDLTARYIACEPSADAADRLLGAMEEPAIRRYMASGYRYHVAATELNLPEIVSFTAIGNRRSQAVMRRLNMRPEPGTFQHLGIPAGHALREHCWYRLTHEGWRP